MIVNQLRRVSLDAAVVIAVIVLLASGGYTYLPPPLQLVALKSLLVSCGLLTAHISGKLLFPKVLWSGQMTPTHYARIALYVVCVYAYSLGG